MSTEGSPLLAFDERASAWMESQGHPAVIAFFLAVTHLNSAVAIGAWSVVFGMVLGGCAKGTGCSRSRSRSAARCSSTWC